MNPGRFGLGAVYSIKNKITRSNKLDVRAKREAETRSAIIEALETRTLLSSSLLNPATATPAATSPQVVSPLVTAGSTGTITVFGANTSQIADGENTPTVGGFTDFDSTAADGTAGTTAGALELTRTYTITNQTTVGTLNLIGSSPVTVSGSSAFTVTAQPTSDSLAAGTTSNGTTSYNSTTFTITFDPKFAGSYTGEVSINSSDPNGAFTFEIHGNALEDVTTSTTGLITATTQAGIGPTVTAADNEILIMEYTGLLQDGTMFDSSQLPNRTPFEFDLGVGQVIQGWDQGLVGMQIGEHRTLIIPASLGYGANGQGSIPANATLIFDTVLLNVVYSQAKVGASYVTIPDAESNPSATNGTDFGYHNPGTAAVTQLFTIQAPPGGLSGLLASPAVTIQGSSAFTVSPIQINTQNNAAQFTVTFTPTTGTSQAVVTVNNIGASNGEPNFTFLVQGEGPASDNGSATYVASTDDITGFAYNPINLAQVDNVEIVISGGPTQTITAELPSPELQSELGTSYHDYSYAMPPLSAGTHSVSIYALDPATNVTTLIGSTTVTSQNSLFDDHYYLTEYPAVSAAVAAGTFSSGYAHYLQYGQYEGFNPNPYWNESYYLQQNPDVAAAVKAGTVTSGFMHYYQYGQYENRPGLLYFNNTYYLQNNPDVAAAVTAGAISSGFEHFVLYGQFEDRSPMLYFSSSVYDSKNQDILPYVTGAQYSSDFEQFIMYGQYEGRIASNFYNEQTYLADNPDVAAAVADGQYPDGFQQWLEYGQYEGRTAVAPAIVESQSSGDSAGLDGTVNAIDYAILASNFNKPVSSTSGWDQGDFNYDGTLNSIDFANLDGNSNTSGNAGD